MHNLGDNANILGGINMKCYRCFMYGLRVDILVISTLLNYYFWWAYTCHLSARGLVRSEGTFAMGISLTDDSSGNIPVHADVSHCGEWPQNTGLRALKILICKCHDRF